MHWPQEGNIRLKREWQHLDEVIGSALQSLAGQFARHGIRVDLPADLPLLEFDSLLMERVFCSLLENAAKHTPPGSRIEIAARDEGDRVAITVADTGPAAGQGRGPVREIHPGPRRILGVRSRPGSGHRPRHRRSPQGHGEGGARFIVTLPVGEPPSVPKESR